MSIFISRKPSYVKKMYLQVPTFGNQVDGPYIEGGNDIFLNGRDIVPQTVAEEGLKIVLAIWQEIV